jgi:hypothetical protein
MVQLTGFPQALIISCLSPGPGNPAKTNLYGCDAKMAENTSALVHRV